MDEGDASRTNEQDVEIDGVKIGRRCKNSKNDNFLTQSQPVAKTIKPTKKIGNDVTNNEDCVLCGKPSNNKAIQCETCEQYYHLNCCGVAAVDSEGVTSFVAFAGWSCLACRIGVRDEMAKLRTELNELMLIDNGEMAKLRTELNELRSKLDLCQNSRPASPTNNTNLTTAADAVRNSGTAGQVMRTAPSDVQRIVRRTIDDLSRRKKNVIISGLAESSDTGDDILFSRFCELNLGMKPYVKLSDTLRLGSATSGQRRLLVRLSNESIASELLKAARN
jgi:hypothetical protein